MESQTKPNEWEPVNPTHDNQSQHDLKGMSREELSALAAQFSQKPFLAGYLFSFIHAKTVAEIDQITPLPKVLRQRLAEAGYGIRQLKLVETFTDPDGTVKYLFELPDGNRIESVVLSDQEGRRTLCLSTQAGCRMACSFCATGKLKFERNLTAGEIVDQFYQAERLGGRIGNAVYMGMGEPFDNYEPVLRSIRLLNDADGRNLGQRHITVSTCGIPEGIDRFAGEDLQVRLAVSLHAPSDAIRRRIMAVGKSWTLEEILEAVRRYQQTTGRRVTFEYCLIQGLNDSDDCASKFVGRIAGIDAAVNLIEYNPHPGCDFEPSGTQRIERFQGLLARAGIETVIRYKRGQTIRAACGQLGADRLCKNKEISE
jgi:23S rRNA (adenine2503-C2)-methyltransferase